jgi:RNA polymerase sigma factor (sigma-70 family)
MGRHDASLLIASFHNNYDALLRFLVGWMGSTERAADVAHDTYLRLVAVRPGEARIDNPRAYIYRVASNLAIDTIRRERRIADSFTGTDVDESVADPTPSLERALLAKERLRRLDAALAELPPKARTALLLFRLDGLSHTAIAEQLGVSESMVAKYLARALRHCRDRLEAQDQK